MASSPHPGAGEGFHPPRRVRSSIRRGTAEIRAVIGVPANAGQPAREDIRNGAAGVFDRVLLIPEPFLAALGFRDEAALWARPTTSTR